MLFWLFSVVLLHKNSWERESINRTKILFVSPRESLINCRIFFSLIKLPKCIHAVFLRETNEEQLFCGKRELLILYF